MKTTQKLLPKYSILLATILLLLIISQVLINSYLQHLENNGRLINIAGRQRMLSQQIVKEQLILEKNAQKTSASLQNLIAQFKFVHLAICTGNNNLPLQPLHKNLLAAYNTVNEQFIPFYTTATTTDVNKISITDSNKYQTEFLTAMDKFVFAAEAFNQQQLQHFQWLQLALALTSIIIIALEVIFIFIPAYNKLIKQHSVLQNLSYSDSHTIRQPLANIIGFSNIISKENLSEQQLTYLQFIEAEAKKLDDLLHQNAAINKS
jgi:nitrate/nitrite-specific signal transduction histidine kinase